MNGAVMKRGRAARVDGINWESSGEACLDGRFASGRRGIRE